MAGALLGVVRDEALEILLGVDANLLGGPVLEPQRSRRCPLVEPVMS
jgi:hypothetical protein